MNLDTSAIAKIKEILAEENTPGLKLRVFVQGGGCAGMQYGFTLDQDQQSEDFLFNFEGVELLVDEMSFQYLQGAQIKYKDDLMGSNFVIDNPNAATGCGCGSSFSPA